MSADAAQKAEAPKQKIVVLLTSGSHYALKTHLGVVNGFGMRKNGHDVDFVIMGEAGHVIDEDMLRGCNGFGLPPIANFLDAPEMADCTWYV